MMIIILILMIILVIVHSNQGTNKCSLKLKQLIDCHRHHIHDRHGHQHHSHHHQHYHHQVPAKCSTQLKRLIESQTSVEVVGTSREEVIITIIVITIIIITTIIIIMSSLLELMVGGGFDIWALLNLAKPNSYNH